MLVAVVYGSELAERAHRELLAELFMRVCAAILRALQRRALRGESCEQAVVGSPQLALLLQGSVDTLLQHTYLQWPIHRSEMLTDNATHTRYTSHLVLSSR